MYNSDIFKNSNRDELISFIREFPFGLIVSNGATTPFATHLPFNTVNENDLKLFAHFSAGNPQAHEIKDGDVVKVIFSGPHSYISPKHYDSKQSVPTWNYIAVHASGNFRCCEDSETEHHLAALISQHEPLYLDQYKSLDPDYLRKMKKGIVAFAVENITLEGKFKLSQNKSEQERKRIKEYLAAQPGTESLSKFIRLNHE